MAIDPKDLLEPPYSFGETSQLTTTCSIHCDAWIDPEQEIEVTFTKEGNKISVLFPEFLSRVRMGALTEDCDIIVGAYFPLAFDSHPLFVPNCRSRHFVGSMQIYDEQSEFEAVVPAGIDYDCENGIFTFEPVTNFALNGFPDGATGEFDAGILLTTVDIYVEEPYVSVEEVPDVDMDYESDREEAYVPKEEGSGGEEEDTSTWTTYTYNAVTRCGAWENGSFENKRTKVIFKKKDKKGIIVLEPIMFPCGYNSSGKHPNEIYIYIGDQIKTFFGNIPTSVLAWGEIYGYFPRKFRSDSCYGTSTGVIYFYNNLLKIKPFRDGVYHGMFARESLAIEQRNVGLQKGITINFNIPDEQQEYISFTVANDINVDNLSFPDNTADFTLKACSCLWEKEHDITVHCRQSDTGSFISIDDFFRPLAKVNMYSIIRIKTEGKIESFFGGYPFTKKYDCNVRMYRPITKDFADVKGYFYYNDGCICFVPDVTDYKYFYSSTTAEGEIGIKSFSTQISVTYNKLITYNPDRKLYDGDLTKTDIKETRDEYFPYIEWKTTAITRCEAWENVKSDNIINYKIEETGNKRIITIEPMLKKIKRNENLKGSEITIEVTNYLKDKIKYFPSGQLGTCKLRIFVPHERGYYKTVPGIIYYYNNKLHITPNYSVYNYFFPLTSSDITSEDIGIEEEIRLVVEQVSSEPSYVNLRTNAGKSESTTYTSFLVASKAWVSGSSFMNQQYGKFEKIGRIKLCNIKSQVNIRVKNKKDVIGITPMGNTLEKVAFKFPAGKLAETDVYTCWNKRDGFLKMNGIFYYYNNNLCIAPEDMMGEGETINYFYGSEDDLYEKTGLANEYTTFYIQIPDTSVSKVDLRPESSISSGSGSGSTSGMQPEIKVDGDTGGSSSGGNDDTFEPPTVENSTIAVMNCEAWDEDPTIVMIFTSKGNERTLQISNYLVHIREDTLIENGVIRINCKEFIEQYLTRIPSGVLAETRVAVNADKNGYRYKEVKGIVYYDGQNICIAPDDEENNIKYFYSTTNLGELNQGTNEGTIGVLDDILISYTLPSDIPEYEDLRAEGSMDVEPEEPPNGENEPVEDPPEEKTYDVGTYEFEYTCEAWDKEEYIGFFTELTFTKTDNYGEITINADQHPVIRSETPITNGVIRINCKDHIESLYGQLPAGKLGECTVQTLYDTSENSVIQTKGIIYFDGNELCIAPEGRYGDNPVLFFISSTKTDTDIQTLCGIFTTTISFTIPETKPTYYDMRSEEYIQNNYY